MSKERLSRLQKWILTEAYENHDLRKKEIYKRFFNVQLGHYESGEHISSELHNSNAVILSRSLKRLIEKGLILELSGWKKSIVLSTEGTKKSKSLMLISKAINNKEG